MFSEAGQPPKVANFDISVVLEMDPLFRLPSPRVKKGKGKECKREDWNVALVAPEAVEAPAAGPLKVFCKPRYFFVQDNGLEPWKEAPIQVKKKEQKMENFKEYLEKALTKMETKVAKKVVFIESFVLRELERAKVAAAKEEIRVSL